MTQQQFGELARLVRRGTQQIEDCNNLLEAKIEEEVEEILGSKRPDTLKLWRDFENNLANTFRYTLFSGVCAVLDECLKAIVEILIPDTKVGQTGRKEGNEKKENGLTGG